MTENKKLKKRRDEYTEVYRRFFPHVYNTVYTKVGNKEETEDICQDIFIAFFNKFEEIDNYRKWLNSVIRNTVMNYYRLKKSDVDIEQMFNDVSLTFVNGFRDARIMIEEAVQNSIKDDDDLVLVDMIAYHNYSYQQVSKLTGLTRRQVVYRYGKIVQTIETFLKKKGIMDLEDLL